MQKERAEKNKSVKCGWAGDKSLQSVIKNRCNIDVTDRPADGRSDRHSVLYSRVHATLKRKERDEKEEKEAKNLCKDKTERTMTHN